MHEVYTGEKMPSKVRAVVSKFQRKWDKEGVFTHVRFVVCGDNASIVESKLSQLLYEYKRSHQTTYVASGLTSRLLDLTESNKKSTGFTHIGVVITR